MAVFVEARLLNIMHNRVYLIFGRYLADTSVDPMFHGSLCFVFVRDIVTRAAMMLLDTCTAWSKGLKINRIALHHSLSGREYV